MKKFVFCRLFETNHGYDYYVEPLHRTGALLKVVSDDFIDASSKKILLQRDEERRVIFGVRQNLPLKDSVGRTRMNFTGYHVESLDELPYFDALSNQFDAIHQEAIETHKALEKNVNAGNKLRDTNIKFSKGSYNSDLAWDRAVKELHDNPDKPLLKMFDEASKELHVPKEYLDAVQPSSRKDSASSETTIAEEALSFRDIETEKTAFDKQQVEMAEKKNYGFQEKLGATSETNSTTGTIDALESSSPRLKMIGKITSIGLIIHAGYNYYLAVTHIDEQTKQRQFDIRRGTLAVAETLAAVGLGFMSRGR